MLAMKRELSAWEPPVSVSASVDGFVEDPRWEMMNVNGYLRQARTPVSQKG
jgi:hypothetical protein